MTLNELTLGIDRLGRLGDLPLVQQLREKLADHLGGASPGKFQPKPVKAAKAGP